MLAPELVNRMTMAPNRCMKCGSGNVEDQSGKVGPFVDLRMDYNWGDSGYLCIPCAEKIAALVGWATPEELKDLEAKLEKKDREIHDTRAKLELIGRQKQAAVDQLNKIREGSRELKKVRGKS